MRAWSLLLLCGIAGDALALGQAIYRCDDGRGGVLYANTPCSGGRVIEVPESKPDPAARERLQRELEAFDRRQAAREAALSERERLAEARRRTAPQTAGQDDETQSSYAPAYGYYGPWYYPPVQRPIKPRPRPQRPPSFLPLR
jgi:Domain of unknown function (DUF4124)